jgi:hypothetical protein
MPIDPTTYRAGDQYRVVGLPASIHSWGSLCLQNGDVVTLMEPPTLEIPLPLRLHLGLETNVGLRIEPLTNWVPAEWVAPTPLSRLVFVCQCDIMATGCVCGVFRAEQARNLSLTKDDQGPT